MMIVCVFVCCCQIANVACALIGKLDPSAGPDVTITADMDEIDVGRVAHEGARRLGVQTFTQPRDLSPGNSRLCLSFMAQLFRARSGLESLPVAVMSVRAPMTARLAAEVIPLDDPVVYVPSSSASGVGDGVGAGQGGGGGGSHGGPVTGRAPVVGSWSLDEAESVEALPGGEAVAFAVYVNNVLASNEVVRHLLPLNEFGHELCERLGDGCIVRELVKTVPVTVGVVEVPSALNPASDPTHSDAHAHAHGVKLGDDDNEHVVVSALRSLERRLSDRRSSGGREANSNSSHSSCGPIPACDGLEASIDEGIAAGYDLKQVRGLAPGIVEGR